MFKDHKPKQRDSSFLPEDYLAKRAERRTSILSVALFICVMLGVTAAFFVSNKEVRDVRKYQEAINLRYAEAAQQLEQLKELERINSQHEQKAEVITALYERVPRSILMAELVNRMPQSATLLQLDLASKRLDKPVRTTVKKGKEAAKDADKEAAKGLADGKASRKASRTTKKKDGDEGDEAVVVTAPRFEATLDLKGVAPTHEDVAQYVASLQECPLLTSVELVQSKRATVEDRELMEFGIRAVIRDDADARRITPLESPRFGAPTPRDAGWDMGGLMNLIGGGDSE